MDLAQYEVMFRAEPSYWWYRGMRAISDAFIDRVYRDRSDLLILDTGCGTAMNCQHLARRGRAIGIDLSPEALRFARLRPVAGLARGSVDALPFPDGTFDLVTSFDVLYHLDVRSEGAAMAELARVAKPGGHVLVRLPAYDWLRSAHDRAVHTRRRFTIGEVRQLFGDAGLAVCAASYANTALFPVAAAARIAERVVRPRTTADPLDNPPVRPVNATLSGVLAAEGKLAATIGLPFGLSAVCLGRKG